jgi:NADPH:quinone reductase-like Zn-dependent oxidoreductase
MTNQRRMQALVVNTVGKYRLEDVDIPTPGSGEVLVKVEVAAQNPADCELLTTNQSTFSLIK